MAWQILDNVGQWDKNATRKIRENGREKKRGGEERIYICKNEMATGSIGLEVKRTDEVAARVIKLCLAAL